MNLARQDNNNSCFIRGNKLYVNNQEYSVEDLNDTEEAAETTEKTRSAPETPTISRHNRVDNKIPNQSQKIIAAESQNKRSISVSSPIFTETDSIKKNTEASDNQKQERKRIETRQQSRLVTGERNHSANDIQKKTQKNVSNCK